MLPARFELEIIAVEATAVPRLKLRCHWDRIGRILPAANLTFTHIKYVIECT